MQKTAERTLSRTILSNSCYVNCILHASSGNVFVGKAVKYKPTASSVSLSYPLLQLSIFLGLAHYRVAVLRD